MIKNQMVKNEYVDRCLGGFECHNLTDFGKDIYGNVVLTFKSPEGDIENVTFSATPMGGINITKGLK